MSSRNYHEEISILSKNIEKVQQFRIKHLAKSFKFNFRSKSNELYFVANQHFHNQIITSVDDDDDHHHHLRIKDAEKATSPVNFITEYSCNFRSLLSSSEQHRNSSNNNETSIRINGNKKTITLVKLLSESLDETGKLRALLEYSFEDTNIDNILDNIEQVAEHVKYRSIILKNETLLRQVSLC